ncbi:MAG: hypothetical protein RR938_08980 [Muribaculaceae bacterium]
MIYKFCIVSDEVENFKREISIDADDTFLSLRNAILDSVGYTKDQMDSFFICNDDWSKDKEITLADMGSDSDEDIWIMEDTPINELIEDDGQKLLYVFDYMTDRAFFMEMKESIPGKDLKDPICQKKEGKPAPQFVEIDVVNEKAAIVVAAASQDLDADFYGDESFNEDELDTEGFDDLTFDDH